MFPQMNVPAHPDSRVRDARTTSTSVLYTTTYVMPTQDWPVSTFLADISVGVKLASSTMQTKRSVKVWVKNTVYVCVRCLMAVEQ